MLNSSETELKRVKLFTTLLDRSIYSCSFNTRTHVCNNASTHSTVMSLRCSLRVALQLSIMSSACCYAHTHSCMRIAVKWVCSFYPLSHLERSAATAVWPAILSAEPTHTHAHTHAHGRKVANHCEIASHSRSSSVKLTSLCKCLRVYVRKCTSINLNFHKMSLTSLNILAGKFVWFLEVFRLTCSFSFKHVFFTIHIKCIFIPQMIHAKKCESFQIREID